MLKLLGDLKDRTVCGAGPVPDLYSG